jgi:hypothetical protein
MTRSSIPLLVVPWMRAFEWRWKVYGVFTRALREADRRRMGAYSVREKQGLVPNLQLDDRGSGGSRRSEVGGIKPLAFGQFGEMGPGLEAPLASMAKRGADEMADRYLIENHEAAVGVQMFHMRHRWRGCSVAGANAGPPW